MLMVPGSLLQARLSVTNPGNIPGPRTGTGRGRRLRLWSAPAPVWREIASPQQIPASPHFGTLGERFGDISRLPPDLEGRVSRAASTHDSLEGIKVVEASLLGQDRTHLRLTKGRWLDHRPFPAWMNTA